MKKRYWLRGGVIGLILGLIVDMYFALQNPCNDYVYEIGFGGGRLNCPHGFAAVPVNLQNDILVYLGFLLIFVIAGLFLGWLYGKIKHRNQRS